MGFTVEDYILHQSVATMAHTDTYKLPKPKSTSPTITQNKSLYKSIQVLSQTWTWFAKYKKQFCDFEAQNKVDKSNFEAAYWQDFLNCIRAEITEKNNQKYPDESNGILRQIVCYDEEPVSFPNFLLFFSARNWSNDKVTRSSKLQK